MSRVIDSLPTPERVKPKKLIVLSRSRVGTLSLYRALKVLGYKPYHTYEIFTNGTTHMNMYEEALRCKYLGAGKPYGKAEFDKWLADYDAILAIPQYFVDEFVEYYPEAKFILTDRDVDAWVKSMSGTVWSMIKASREFPLSAVRWVDPWVDAFCQVHFAWEDVMFQGKGLDHGIEEAKCDYIIRQQKAKAQASKVNLLVLPLEKGIGWEEVCPFLGHDTPDTPYPRTNSVAEFQVLIGNMIQRKSREAAIKVLTMTLVPAAGIWAVWYYVKRW
ncbi:hypothetical protein PT974_04979 [Cladobotryum mycophilum]|uniref:P-loop containing nucleoside triphosphate hydrolase protein n=1 Tax=Cladobotryum mycophilum TaxID=491253 RepID=A0ABR0SRE8_9HYPO